MKVAPSPVEFAVCTRPLALLVSLRLACVRLEAPDVPSLKLILA